MDSSLTYVCFKLSNPKCHLVFDSTTGVQLLSTFKLQTLSLSLPTSQMYSLKDHKQVKPDTNLRGLGPDYTAIEKTVSTDLQ